MVHLSGLLMRLQRVKSQKSTIEILALISECPYKCNIALVFVSYGTPPTSKQSTQPVTPTKTLLLCTPFLSSQLPHSSRSFFDCTAKVTGSNPFAFAAFSLSALASVSNRPMLTLLFCINASIPGRPEQCQVPLAPQHSECHQR